MAPQLEASGAEPTLANCVQTALRILAAAPGMGSSRRPAYKGGFIRRGWRQRGGGTAPLHPAATPPPRPPPSSRSWALALGGVSYLPRFLNLEKGEGSYLELQSQEDSSGSPSRFLLHVSPPQMPP